MRKISFFADKYLLVAVISLVIVGLMMVASASMAISERQFNQPFHYLIHQILYIVLGLGVSIATIRLQINIWQKIAPFLLLMTFALLILVLVPGIGKHVNGSTRWLGFGPLGLQVSELAKFTIIVYLASYLTRHNVALREKLGGFVRPMCVLGVAAFLLLLEPDFGATVVIMLTALTMMYLAGARLWQFSVLLLLVLIVFAILAVSAPYRLARLTGFLNPWQHQFNSGYQLTQSLIAFGRGGLFGVGLGKSIQKLFYLPEAHTDFLFAVLGEELGLIGVLAVIGLYILIVVRAFIIGRTAQANNFHTAGFIAYGFACWFGLQALINIGVDSGLFPTKGLTLPFISYGGSSMLLMFVAVTMLFRIDYENRTLMPSEQ